jgi:hypothetical protein
MNIVSVTTALADRDLNPPSLNVLEADANNYSTHLLQPRGHIEVTDTGIKNLDTNEANAKFRGFIEGAINSGADLVVTPEYSTCLFASRTAPGFALKIAPP